MDHQYPLEWGNKGRANTKKIFKKISILPFDSTYCFKLQSTFYYIIYDFIGLLILILSPIIISIRIATGKEDPKRFLEKLCLYSSYRNINKTVWFHGASIGEITSIIPIVEALEKNKKIKKILITYSTTSSAILF